MDALARVIGLRKKEEKSLVRGARGNVVIITARVSW